MSFADALVQTVGSAISSASGTAIDIAKQNRAEAIKREGWDRQDQRTADERTYQEGRTADQRAYQENKTSEERTYQQKLTSEERSYQEGQAKVKRDQKLEDEATTFDRQKELLKVKGSGKTTKLKEVKGGIKYFEDGTEEPIGQSETVENPITGKRFTPQQAQSTLAEAKEFQLKNGGFAITLDEGLQTIDRMYSEGYDPTKAAWVGAAFDDGAVSNLLRSEEDQVFMGSVDEMINAIARRETGAAITEFERKDFFNRYMPRPGDTGKRLDQKRNSLERQLKSIAGQSGGVFEALKITGEDDLYSPTRNKSFAEDGGGESQVESQSDNGQYEPQQIGRFKVRVR